jgi:hypothetical protein
MILIPSKEAIKFKPVKSRMYDSLVSIPNENSMSEGREFQYEYLFDSMEQLKHK